MAIAVNSDSRAQYARAGFSLLEIMIAVMILGLVAGLVGPKVMQFLEDSKIRAAQTTLKIFRNSIDLYRADINQLPTKLKDLIKKPAGDVAKKWKHAYLDKDEEPDDPWGVKYHYKVTPGASNNKPYELWSWGGIEGKSEPKEKRISVWDEKNK